MGCWSRSSFSDYPSKYIHFSWKDLPHFLFSSAGMRCYENWGSSSWSWSPNTVPRSCTTRKQDGTGHQLSRSKTNISPPTTKVSCSCILFVFAKGWISMFNSTTFALLLPKHLQELGEYHFSYLFLLSFQSYPFFLHRLSCRWSHCKKFAMELIW